VLHQWLTEAPDPCQVIWQAAHLCSDLSVALLSPAAHPPVGENTDNDQQQHKGRSHPDAVALSGAQLHCPGCFKWPGEGSGALQEA